MKRIRLYRIKFGLLFFVALCLAEPAVGQVEFDRLFFKDGTEKVMDIWKDSEDLIYGFYPGISDLQKVEKILLRKIVYRDGRETIFADEAAIVAQKPQQTAKSEKPKRTPDPEPAKRPKEPREKRVRDELFVPGDVQLEAGVRLPFSGLNTYKILPLWLEVEAGVVKIGKSGVVSVGASGDYSQKVLGSNVGYYANIRQFSMEAKAGYHFFVTRTFDVHCHLGAGYKLSRSAGQSQGSSSTEKKSSGGFSSSALLGISYYLSSQLAVSAEIGHHNGGTARFGIIFNL